MNKNILMVDDEEIICASIKFNLEKMGFKVDVAMSGEEAVEKLETRNKYDLVITDLMMGLLSGVDVLKKSQLININVPVLVMTGYGKSALYGLVTKSVDRM